MVRELSVTLRNDLAEIPRLAERVEAFGEEVGIAQSAIYHLNLVLDELITNVISYGFEDGGEHAIEVVLREEGDRVRAEVIDDGKPFDPLSEAPPPVLEADLDDRPIGGLGVHFVKTLMEEVGYTRADGRNRLFFSKRKSG